MLDAEEPRTIDRALKDLRIEHAFIGGRWCDSVKGERIGVNNPATGQSVGSVPNCGAAEAREAVATATKTLKSWRRRPAAERSCLLMNWYAAICARADELAQLLTAEEGKPLGEAKAEISYAASFISWFAGEAIRVAGHDISSPMHDRRILVMKEPVGVCAAITPWNFPAAMVTRKIAPALAAGCTVVVKPSELTPFTALALAALAQEAGIPDGVINVVTGDPASIGEELTTNPLVRKLSFTGSTDVGRLLMRQSAKNIQRLSLELGGNAPFIVFDDADIDAAIDGLRSNKFRNAGQTCVCANRVLVQAGIHDQFVDRLATVVASLEVGDGRSPTTTVGPLISAKAADKVRAHIDDALRHGSTCAAKASLTAARAEFVPPILLTDATPAMRFAQEETFGPLIGVIRFETEEQAVAIANDTPFGLAAYFYTRDAQSAWRVGDALEYGMVGVNTGSVSLEMAPFGGIKQSGLGREGGREGIEEYLELKTLHWGGLG
jgi:succinate-semialdehyde dehydrogenase/glutarate-semialdehyde dehydrogenase